MKHASLARSISAPTETHSILYSNTCNFSTSYSKRQNKNGCGYMQCANLKDLGNYNVHYSSPPFSLSTCLPHVRLAQGIQSYTNTGGKGGYMHNGECL